MTGAPDLINPLPVLRAFKAREHEAGLASEVIRKHVYKPGTNIAVHHKDLSPSCALPQPCQCGFYGHYPWVVSRWPAVGPLTTKLPVPTPMLISFVRSYIWLTDFKQTPVAGVLDVFGSVSLHDSGARASKAAIRAIVKPESLFDMLPQDVCIETLLYLDTQQHDCSFDGGRRCFRFPWFPQQAIDTAELQAEHYDVPMISLNEAVDLGREWGEVGKRCRSRWNRIA